MTAIEIYALVGALSHGTLCLLHTLVWRSQRRGWSACFAAAFALSTVVFLFDAQLQPQGNDAQPVAGTLAAITVVLLSIGMIDYCGLPRRAAWVLRIAAVAVAAVSLGFVAVHWMSRVTAFTIVASYLVVLAGLSLYAMRREPRSGHGLVAFVLLMYPGVIVATKLGLFDMALLRYTVIFPLGVVGATVLTTGLLRARRQARDELERRQQAERELHALNDSLERRVTQRTAELHDVVVGLESFNRSVSHDLRGPLGGIVGLAGMAADALRGDDPSRALPMIEAIGRQAANSAQLVGDLLALARMADADFQPQPVDLQQLVRDTLDQLREADPQAGRVDLAIGPLPTVLGDPGLLRQALVNLVGNAIKFSHDASAPRVEVGAERRHGEQIVYVRDNGIGFDAALAPRLFEPFQRLHGTRYPGHGVGLSIVKRVVERHGGRVWAESAPDAGATFYFSLERR